MTPPSSFGTLNSLDRYHLKILKELKVNSKVTKNIVRVLTSFRDFYERDHPWLYTEECIIRSLSFVLGDEEELTSKLSMFIANKTSIKDIFKKLLLSYGREMSFLSRLNEFTKAVNDDVSSPSEVFDKISSLIYLPGLQLEESNRIGLNQARLYVNRIGGHILPSIIDQAMQFGKKTTFEDFRHLCLLENSQLLHESREAYLKKRGRPSNQQVNQIFPAQAGQHNNNKQFKYRCNQCPRPHHDSSQCWGPDRGLLFQANQQEPSQPPTMPYHDMPCHLHSGHQNGNCPDQLSRPCFISPSHVHHSEGHCRRLLPAPAQQQAQLLQAQPHPLQALGRPQLPLQHQQPFSHITSQHSQHQTNQSNPRVHELITELIQHFANTSQ